MPEHLEGIGDWIPWLITAASGVLNLVFGFLVIPTRQKLDRVEEQFRRCKEQHGAKLLHTKLETERQAEVLSRVEETLGKVRIALAETKMTLKANDALMQEVRAELAGNRGAK